MRNGSVNLTDSNAVIAGFKQTVFSLDYAFIQPVLYYRVNARDVMVEMTGYGSEKMDEG